MRKVKTNFLIYRWVVIGVFVAGLALIIIFRTEPKTFWLGFGLTLTLMAAELFIADFIAEKRAVYYSNLLEEFNQKAYGLKHAKANHRHRQLSTSTKEGFRFLKHLNFSETVFVPDGYGLPFRVCLRYCHSVCASPKNTQYRTFHSMDRCKCRRTLSIRSSREGLSNDFRIPLPISLKIRDKRSRTANH
jgi:hypothetical protein